MKKRVLPILAAVLLLTGCGGNPLPEEPFEIEAQSLGAAVTDPAALKELEDDGTWEGRELKLLAEVPGEELAFYHAETCYGKPDVYLLRWGDDGLAYSGGSEDFVSPRAELTCLDLNGDGEDEVVLACEWYGTQASGTYLHVVEREDGGLTDRYLPTVMWKRRGTWYSLDAAEFAADGDALFLAGFLREMKRDQDWEMTTRVFSASVTYADGTFVLSDIELQ